MRDKLRTDVVLKPLTRKLVKALSLVSVGMALSGLVQARSGSLDLTFGHSGKVIGRQIDEPTSKIALQSDGKILVAGWHTDQSGAHFFLARYNQNGSMDTSFGVGGPVNTANEITASAVAVAIQPDGKIDGNVRLLLRHRRFHD
jgi:uncharacterized delta-60 repeat protein